jgi:adenylate cyclase
MARLVFGTASGEQVVELKPFNGLGRHPSNSIQLMDKIASKEHCVIEQRGPTFVLRDLGSLNGTFVNAQRVNGERSLRHGDEIEIGMTKARFDDGVSPRTYPKLPISPEVVHQRAGGSGAAWAAVPAPLPTANSPHATPPPPPSYNTPAITPLRSNSPGERSATMAPPQGWVGPPPAAPPRPLPGLGGVEVNDQARQIGTRISAVHRGFQPFDQIERNRDQLRHDYEQLRMMVELTREIGLEHDLDKLLGKILRSLFRFVAADRGCILLMQPDGTLKAAATQRRDGGRSPMRLSSTLLNHVVRDKTAVLTQDAAGDFASGVNDGRSMVINRIASAIVVPLTHEGEMYGVLWLDSELLAQFKPKDLELVTSVATQASMFIANTILEKKIEHDAVLREQLSRMISPNVAEQVIKGKLDVRKGGMYLNQCTVFNSDIRGFTRMSEGVSPELMIDMLNEYFELMVEILFRHEGTLDKFMGDGIMALFGAPVSRHDDEVRSIRCALDMMEQLARFNRERSVRGIFPFEIGIGIHTGPLVAGYVGSSKSLSYTVIGDTANTSARLCSIATAGEIVVSEQTADLIRGQFQLDELPPAQLKGKEKPMRIYNVKR